MNASRIGWTVSIVLLMAGGWSGPAWAGDGVLPTKMQRLEFLKGYNSWSPRERRESLKRLLLPEYRNNAMVGAALHDIVVYDKDPEARLNAFVALCNWYDEDGRLAYHLARLFMREITRDIKPKMAQAMTQLKFKTDVLNVLIKYTFSPGVDNNWGGWSGYGRGVDGGQARDRNGVRRGWGGHDPWLSRNYRMLLDSINKMTGKNFIPSYYTSQLVIRWWNLNAIDFQADDRKLAERHRKEGRGIGALAAAEPAEGRVAERALAEVLDRQEKQAPKQRTKDVLNKLEPPQHAAQPAVDEDEIE